VEKETAAKLLESLIESQERLGLGFKEEMARYPKSHKAFKDAYLEALKTAVAKLRV